MLKIKTIWKYRYGFVVKARINFLEVGKVETSISDEPKIRLRK